MPVRPLLSIALLLAFPSLAIAQSGSNLPSPEAAQEQDLLEQSTHAGARFLGLAGGDGE